MCLLRTGTQASKQGKGTIQVAGKRERDVVGNFFHFLNFFPAENLRAHDVALCMCDDDDSYLDCGFPTNSCSENVA